MANNENEVTKGKKPFEEPPQEDLPGEAGTIEPPPPQDPVPEEPDKGLNFEIPIAVARISWPHSPREQEQYVRSTAPILDLLEFHKCLGPVGDLPPTVRFIVGMAVIIGGVVVIKVAQRPKQPRKPPPQRTDRPQEAEEETQEETATEQPEATEKSNKAAGGFFDVFKPPKGG